MDKYLRTGLVCMIAAVVLMPVAILLKRYSNGLMLAVLILTMILELIGLSFVIINIIKKRKG
ncbi:MAG: hypothetical protein V4541_03145 [Bacteroidota bacterium]